MKLPPLQSLTDQTICKHFRNTSAAAASIAIFTSDNETMDAKFNEHSILELKRQFAQ